MTSTMFQSLQVGLGSTDDILLTFSSQPTSGPAMIVLDVKFNLKDDCSDEAVAAMKVVAAETLKENGCAEYRFALPISDGLPIVLFEEWESQDALNAHFETEHLAKFRATMKELLKEPPIIRRYVVSEAGSL